MARVAALSGKHELDRAALFDYLVLGDAFGVEPWRTILTDVRRVPPGWTLSFPGGRPLVTARRSAPTSSGQPPLLHALASATRRSLADDARIAVLASGGLDSSTLAVLARELGYEVILATAAPEVMTIGEQACVAELADFTGCATLTGGWAPLLPALDAASTDTTHPRGGLYAGLFADLGAQAARLGVTALVTGDGADDLFEDPGVGLCDALLTGDAKRTRSATASIFRSSQGRGRIAALGIGLSSVIARRALAPAARLAEVASASSPLLSPEVGRSLAPARRIARLREWSAVPRGQLAAHVIRRDLMATAESCFPAPAGQERCIRRACPFRDPALVDVIAAAAPWELTHLGGRREKWMLRAAVAGMLPESVRRADKLGRLDLHEVFLRREGDVLLARIADAQRRLEGFLVALAGPEDLVERAGADTASWVRLLCLEALLRRVDETANAHAHL